MYKSTLVKMLRTFALVMFVALLAACGSGRAIKNGTTAATDVPASYDLTVAADKDGQFDFDGATLTPEDLRGYIRFLSEAGRPVHAILLKPGATVQPKYTPIAALASLCRELKITAYVQDYVG